MTDQFDDLFVALGRTPVQPDQALANPVEGLDRVALAEQELPGGDLDRRGMIYRTLIEAGIGLEHMGTGAACRTYNILAAEGRAVAAALIVEP